MAQLDIQAVTKTFGTVSVLKDINLNIRSGEFIVFVGPSGCGKSTLLRMITGLETVSSGEIRIEGARVNETDPAQRGTAMVFQSYALYPHMSVAENMGFSLRMAGQKKTEIRDRVARAAAILRLDKLLDRRPGQLSGGQKQRVAIGRAIVREPKVFLFDEPLSNLDAELRVKMRAELLDLHRRLKATMIYVTHDQVEAMTLADRMVVMNGGIVQQFGRPLDLYDDPDNLFVAGFIGSPRMNVMSAEVAEVTPTHVTVTSPGGADARLILPFRGLDPSIRQLSLGIRPEHVRLAEAGEGLPVAVDFVEELGDVTYIHGSLPAGERLVIRSGVRRLDPTLTTCHAALDPARFLLFDSEGQRLRESGSLPA
ncbi:sn-glycerol-3-phosphate ABC transporter ATP-binding protein UgpC [Cereibacter changlensis]|uniref:sn-glycerol-3-phosphate ABC transporter ATP-binding protein UgpC n=1 Tax=Cereibacter changlensis TaxID=402884 RepID=A0A4U0YXZ5_9RHOB|nr:sn-glycerol-3-phosphate ABC transporter ATP-binding protein UgpC [Cereibacter changlensis]TKA94954.1 sn-glycerol-3-phosphate ABC transporter ATP-binding protein UgpC [Cereibacter changlensis]